MADKLVPLFCDKYGCQSSDLVVHHGTGTNAGRTFLIIKDPTVALKVLMQGVGKTLDEAIQNTKVNGKYKYIEGALRNVVMKGHERSPKARQACLKHYGYNCYACGTNLYTRYRGLSSEFIHVHHEKPLGTTSGPREVDPVADMKPLCPNCHGVIHSRKPPYSIAQLKEMLREETQGSFAASGSCIGGTKAGRM
jgi:predicted HNH restriction endonuclease